MMPDHWRLACMRFCEVWSWKRAGGVRRVVGSVALFCGLWGFAGGVAGQAGRVSPERVVAGADSRVEAVFRAEAGKPLRRAAKQPPLSPGRGEYVRGYSFSIVGFAARCLVLDEMLEQANAALAENAQYYLDHPLAIVDRDSFHWHADVVLRLIEMYGSHGSVAPGRITPQTEALCLQPIWAYVSKCSWLRTTDYQQHQTWETHSSENHHAMHITVCWHFSKLAKDRPEYKDRQYDQGGSPAEHYRAWSDYFVVYCLERARKGICVEMMSGGYNSTMIKAFYNFYDFGEPAVKDAAGKLLDLYFAYWAQEQIDGVQGGGRSRIYFHKAFHENDDHGMAPLAWCYFGIGEPTVLHGHDINPLLSSYRPPAVVADIALDVAGRGTYEVYQRVQGLGTQGHTFPRMDAFDRAFSLMNTDGGGVLRYSYCDPAFILGTPMVEARPHADWVGISSQNRWQGAIFAGDGDARIVPIVRPRDNRAAFNTFWSVQRRGCLITQKLRTNKGGEQMLVWLSEAGLSEPVEEDGIVFVESQDAYAAVRVARGGYSWLSEMPADQTRGFSLPNRPAHVMVLNDSFAPVILEVMSKREARSFSAFKARVRANAVSFDGSVLSYRSVYGDTITLDTRYADTPTINGEPVDYAPPRVFNSPFITADYDAGVVTIRKGRRTKVLDFNAAPG